MKIKHRILPIVAFLCLISFATKAQITKTQANDLVLNQILQGDLGHVNVYVATAQRTGGETITLATGNQINTPYTNNWVYFVDDIPYANWAHDCRYIFVNAGDGSYTTVTQNFFPDDWEQDYEIISEIPTTPAINLPINPNPVYSSLEPSDNRYALFMCGWDSERFWRDNSAMYNTLVEVYGYKKENIFVHFCNGYSNCTEWGDDFNGIEVEDDDIDYDAHITTIEETFRNLTGEWNTLEEVPKLTAKDQLFVFADGHGNTENGHSYLDLNVSNPNEKLFDYQLAEYMEDLECSNIIGVFQPCLVGGFVRELTDTLNYNNLCKNRVIHSASDSTVSWSEVWITDNNYCEFVYYWMVAERGYFPDNNMPWELIYPTDSFPFHTIQGFEDHPPAYHPDLNEDGYVQMAEAFDYANNFDTKSEYGYIIYWDDTYNWDYEVPQERYNILFSEDLVTMHGLAGTITHSYNNINRNYVFGGNITITESSTVCFTGITELFIENNSSIIIEFGSSLNINGDNTFRTTSENNSIEVYGNMNINNKLSTEVDINVKSGGTLTITSAQQLELLGNATITVEQGGALNIESNFTFTSIDGYSSVEVYGNMTINDKLSTGVDIKVKPNGILTVSTNKYLELLSNTQVIVEDGGTISIEDNATIKGRNSSNKIVVNGTLQPGNNLSFEPVFYMEFWEGLELNTPNASCNLGSPSFTNCGISGDCKTLTLSSASFNKGNVFITSENTTISNSTFNNGFISIDHPGGRPSTGINISGCSISNVNDDDARGAILIDGHPEFVICNNTPLQNFPSQRSRSCYC